MSQMYDANRRLPGGGSEDDLEKLLSEGVTLDEDTQAIIVHTTSSREEDDEDSSDAPLTRDVQGALGLFAEAAQDLATAGVEVGLGRHFACADFCNQAVEKAAQSVALLRFGRRVPYNHDLRALGAAVGAPPAIQDEMAILTPFHPEAFYMDTPPEEADEVISAEQASNYVQHARHILRWARGIVLNP